MPDLDLLRATLASAGAWSPVAYVALVAALLVVAAPRNVLSALGAAVFGLAPGAALAWFGALLGGLAAFGLARRLGRPGLACLGVRLHGDRLARLDGALRDHGVESVAVARLVPVVPFTAVSYGAGLLRVPLRAYAVGTAVGTIPGTVAYAAVGAYGAASFSAMDATTRGVVAGLALVVALAAAARLWRRRRSDADEPVPPVVGRG